MRWSSKRFSSFLCAVGLSLLVVGWGGAWGSAYGQTAGPTPTGGTAVSPITVLKAVTPSNAGANELLTFSIQVRNNDSVPQTNVVVTDRILDFLEIVSVTTTKGTASFSGQDVRVEVGTLDPGETVTVTITTRVRPATQSGSSGVNIANVTADGNGGGPGIDNNSNPVAISIGQAPPSGLPNTGSPAPANLWMIAGGLLLLMAGATMCVTQRRRAAR